MREFFVLEGAYIILGVFILAISVFVTTRKFMSAKAPKIGISATFAFVAIMIFGHFYITTNRMNSVKNSFNAGEEILCENRIYTKASQFISIKNSRDWKIKGDYFVSPHYKREFHISRCIIK